MLVEAGGAAAFGPVMAYATATARRAGVERTPDTLFSREHWLQLRLSESTTVRAGRIVLPFGLRVPDHTQYTREAFRFDKWDQSYAVELDLAHEAFMLSAA